MQRCKNEIFQGVYTKTFTAQGSLGNILCIEPRNVMCCAVKSIAF